MIQSIIATLIVLAAATWLLRRIYVTIRAACRGETGKLGSCGTCSHNPANEQSPVIKLGVQGSRSANRSPASSTDTA